ncbi:MAG TPA: ABC transporter ATP-binding protein [Acidimicrobiales bacterium]|nr:ABC transporter ATP-binding protein [Acidimicrobiales bacterium]
MEPVITTEQLSKHFGRTTALDRLTLEVGRGEVFGFLGPNGAGKTTTVRLLMGLLKPTSGAARVLGLDAWEDPTRLHARVAYVPGEFAIWPQLTGGEMLELLGSLHGSADIGYRDELCERFDFDPTKRGRSYSKGNRQKIAVIAALMTRAELFVCDEPTAGLDPLMEATFRDCIGEARERDQTVFLSSHVLAEVEALCDRIGILRGGRLVDVGTLAELRHLEAHTVEIRFQGEVPDLSAVEGASNISWSGESVRLEVRGSTAPLLKAIAPYDVVSLESREPTLEEVFLSHYGPDGT